MSDRYGFEIPLSTGPVPARTALGQPLPVEHPRNCKHECPYGHDRAFCFPCMAKIMGEHRAANRSRDEDEGMAAVKAV